MAIQKPSLSIFTGSKDLGYVFSEQNQINIKFSEFNLPFTDSTGNAAVNWKGKTRVIMVQGAHYGDGFDGVDQNGKLSDFIFEMEEWLNAPGIQGAITYTDSFGVQYSVKAFDWQWKRTFQNSAGIIYSLLLKEV